ncbi:MAG: energy transducer TonB [Proteobacteria bacterium]|nr:energy transducer TonB [Pseudomonadota bacterium]
MSRLLPALMALALMSASAVAQQRGEPPLLSGTEIPQGFVPPKVIDSTIKVFYPPGAMRCGLTGRAIVELLIDDRGNVSSAKIIKVTGYTALDLAAVSSVKQWHYTPATKDGFAVVSRIDTGVDFKLPPDTPVCDLLPPKSYSNGITPGFSWVEPPDSSLQPGESILFQDDMVASSRQISRTQVHVPDKGEKLRINYSINTPTSRMRMIVLTDDQNRSELRGVPSGPYPLDAVVSGRGSQAVSLTGGEYWLVWIPQDNAAARIVSYVAIASEN